MIETFCTQCNAKIEFREIEDVAGETNTKASLLKLIDRIPGDIGWYSHSNKEAFYDIAFKQISFSSSRLKCIPASLKQKAGF